MIKLRDPESPATVLVGAACLVLVGVLFSVDDYLQFTDAGHSPLHWHEVPKLAVMPFLLAYIALDIARLRTLVYFIVMLMSTITALIGSVVLIASWPKWLPSWPLLASDANGIGLVLSWLLAYLLLLSPSSVRCFWSRYKNEAV